MTTDFARDTAPPIVGIGASAGSLEALQALFAQIPPDSGLAFVVIQHLDPRRPSLLATILRGGAAIPVVEVLDGMPADLNRIHVIPPACDLTVRNGVLNLVPRKKTGELHLPIDAFFRSLAADQGSRAIGVVLSGSGSDGTEGLHALKAEGGIGIAQSPDSAQFRSMPESAIAAGVVDFCAPAAEIGLELVRLSQQPYVLNGRIADHSSSDDTRNIAAILATVRKEVGVDFTLYKQTTVRRRIERRMALRHLSATREYAQAVHDDPDEARALARDMLIHVTTFFRDPAAFEVLKTAALEKLVREKEEGAFLRVWVPGCSTGEEVYAIGICLLECLTEQKRDIPIKLFGSDLSDKAIFTARAGLYAAATLKDVPPDRLSRFFEPVEGGYRVVKRLRDLCVFVKHDLTRDPPFARLDLISCRNVLIYFDAELQRRVIPMLHYCLTNPGYLFLGASESITSFRDLFAPVGGDQRIFLKTGDSPRFAYPLAPGRRTDMKVVSAANALTPNRSREAVRQADHLLLSRFAPPGIVVNDRLEIVQFRGRTGAYLEVPSGRPETNVMRMVRPDLVAHLHEAIEHAKAESVGVRREGVRISSEGGQRIVDVEVVPLAASEESSERYFLILFQEQATREEGSPSPEAAREHRLPADTDEVRRLKADLLATKDYLKSVISENESAGGELAATNDELIATNEELQSTNEELQSAKEELQSVNEELTTMNDELTNRNAELDKVANDLVNILASVEIPIIIVDMNLRVRRFTPKIRDIAAFIPSDVGRPIDDLRLKVQIDNLEEKIREVIQGTAPKEWEIRNIDGRWFRMQVRPYRTTDNRLDGAVLSFVDVDALKHALGNSENAREYVRSIVEAVSTPLVVLDSELLIKSANRAFYELFALSPDTADGKNLLNIDSSALDMPTVRHALLNASTQQVLFDALAISVNSPHLGRKELSITARPISWDSTARLTLLAVEDVTELRRLEAERTQLLRSETNARQEAERANRAKDLFLATLSHELRTPLSTVLMQAQVLKRATIDPRVDRASAVIERSITTQTRLIDDLLDVSRIVSGKLILDLRNVNLADIVRNAVDVARPSADAKSLSLTADISDAIGAVYGDAVRLQQVVSNVLTNAIKFTPHGGRVGLRLEQLEGLAVLTVSDNGQGIPADVLPNLFERFVQADSTVTRTHGGLGLGLAIVRHLVEAHGGKVSASSAGEGQGATVRITLPVGAALPGGERSSGTAPMTNIRGIRVLLVEDEDDAREVFAQLLTQLGADVRTTASAVAALALLEQWQPDVILSDIAMPGEDGYSFIGKVRRLRPNQGGTIPAAALTALASAGDRKRALEAGFQMHLTKPCEAARLVAAVASLAAGRSYG